MGGGGLRKTTDQMPTSTGEPANGAERREMPPIPSVSSATPTSTCNIQVSLAKPTTIKVQMVYVSAICLVRRQNNMRALLLLVLLATTATISTGMLTAWPSSSYSPYYQAILAAAQNPVPLGALSPLYTNPGAYVSAFPSPVERPVIKTRVFFVSMDKGPRRGH
ncbi:hypothetical protein Q1695_002627 [Nippostrongylus brasiliensis]|nr:hypothetical protein Q1695_002627 [Nippostrongylus brasiliensis]